MSELSGVWGEGGSITMGIGAHSLPQEVPIPYKEASYVKHDAWLWAVVCNLVVCRALV